LDAMELIFHPGFVSPHGLEELVADFNDFFRADDLPFAITDYTWEESVGEGMFAGLPAKRVTEYPRVIRADSQITYALAVKPTLDLLSDGRFRAANAEFLGALEDFRKNERGDCLTKCTSSLESVMKVICDLKGWPYNQTDTAAPLLKIVINRSGLESFFEQPLMLIVTIRNRLSSSHGGGTETRKVSPAKAEFAVNATAAAILLLVRHCL